MVLLFRKPGSNRKLNGPIHENQLRQKARGMMSCLSDAVILKSLMSSSVVDRHGVMLSVPISATDGSAFLESGPSDMLR